MRDSEGKPLDLSGFSSVNIRNLSIKCGNCDSYQTMAGFAQGRDWNVYTFECENGVCAPAVTRTLVEVPRELDEYATRDPEWRGGKRHAGSGDDS
ncbi:MAG: hypothetical protein VYE73_02470 [Acidobacteriota bacterium]|nr:hypothetical protein [Acidobacteriota bacterium]